MKLLLIDDQINILISLKEALEPGGHRCELFDRPKEALQRFEKEAFDAVVTDLKMPQMDGIEVLKRVQTLKPGTPVIIMTGYADTENAIQAVNYGAYAFYQKPIKIKKFIETLKALEQWIARRNERDLEFGRLTKERSAMLSEVAHRVKDNLQVITSLLRIQLRSVSNPETAEALLDANNRIRAMALIHDYLCASESPVCIRMYEYIPVLAHELRQSLAGELAVDLVFDLAPMCMPLEEAIPTGMILNELIANAMRHAFVGTAPAQPKIEISLAMTRDQRIRLGVSDNGVGLSPAIDLDSVQTVGLSIVRILIQDQLRGEVRINRRKGTRFEILLHQYSEVTA